MNNIFKSKRNRVWLENGRVYKLLAGVDEARAEAAVLEKLFAAGVSVPRVFYIK